MLFHTPRNILLGLGLFTFACSHAHDHHHGDDLTVSEKEQVEAVLQIQGDVGVGEEVYHAKCTVCHESSTPQVDDPASLEEHIQALTDPVLVRIILFGWGRMPQPNLTDQECADVVSYLRDRWGVYVPSEAHAH